MTPAATRAARCSPSPDRARQDGPPPSAGLGALRRARRQLHRRHRLRARRGLARAPGGGAAQAHARRWLYRNLAGRGRDQRRGARAAAGGDRARARPGHASSAAPTTCCARPAPTPTLRRQPGGDPRRLQRARTRRRDRHRHLARALGLPRARAAHQGAGRARDRGRQRAGHPRRRGRATASPASRSPAIRACPSRRTSATTACTRRRSDTHAAARPSAPAAGAHGIEPPGGAESAHLSPVDRERAPRHFDQLSGGESLTTAGRTITEADLVSFSALTGDWHPQHADADWAAAGRFGERVAHGMLVLSYAVGLMPFDPERVVALRGLDSVSFKRPVRIGDTIRVRCRGRASAPARRRAPPGHARLEGLSGEGRTALRAELQALWRRRPQDEASAERSRAAAANGADGRSTTPPGDELSPIQDGRLLLDPRGQAPAGHRRPQHATRSPTRSPSAPRRPGAEMLLTSFGRTRRMTERAAAAAARARPTCSSSTSTRRAHWRRSSPSVGERWGARRRRRPRDRLRPARRARRRLRLQPRARAPAPHSRPAPTRSSALARHSRR